MGKVEIPRALPDPLRWRHWIVLLLLIALLGYIYSLMLSRMNVQVYEVETLPSSFEDGLDLGDPLARNSHARFVHDNTPNDGGKTVFFGPRLDLEPGDYRVSFAIRALQVLPGAEPLRVEVGDRAGGEVLASQATDVRQLNTEAYDEITVDFSVDSYTPGIEFRAFYPGRGAYWFDYVKIRRETNTPWNMAYIYWPLLAGLLAAVLFVNQRTVADGIPLNTALRNPTVERRLAILGNLALLGIGLFSFAGKYAFDVERIIYAYVIDDAFYYFETAANLARQGKMSFDGITFSNGFHPLWLSLLVPIYWLGLDNETSFLAGTFLADVLGLVSTLLLFWVLRRRFNVLLAFALTLLFFSQAIYPLQYGLETPALIGSFVALLALYEVRFQQRLADVSFRDCALLGLLLGAVVLARLDHGIFLATFLLLVLVFNWRSLLVAQERKKLATIVVVVAAVALPYLVFNLAATGHILPASGVIKRVWSQKALAGAMRYESYFQAKADSFLMVLAEQKVFFWSLVGSLLIVWVLLARHRSTALKTFLPFILGPMMVFVSYLLFSHYPFNSSVWYYPTIWLAGLLTIGLVIDMFLDQFRIWDDSLVHGILIGGLTVILAFQVKAQFDHQQTFFHWVRTQSFEDRYKFLSWRAAEYVQDHVWSPGADDKVVFAAADAGVLGFVLDEPVVNLDGLINNEILEYELQDKHWHVYTVEKSEIDYVVNAFRKNWSPPPLFEQHFIPCYISPDLNRDDLGFRIYGRKTAVQGTGRDSFAAGCVEGQLSSWSAGEMLSGYALVRSYDEDGRAQAIRCAVPAESGGNTALVFGPHISLPAGTYEVDFFLSVDDNIDPAAAAQLDVVNPIDAVVAELPAAGEDFETVGEFQRFTIPFRLTSPRDSIEFRVLPTGEQGLCVQGIRLMDCENGCDSHQSTN